MFQLNSLPIHYPKEENYEHWYHEDSWQVQFSHAED